MNEYDLQLLEGAVRNILYVIERRNVADEDARERVKEFRLFVNDSVQKSEKDGAPLHAVEEKEKPIEGRGEGGILQFTEKEIIKMPKQFRSKFRVGKIVAHVRKKENGVFEIRCQINKQPICASSKLLETAKGKFITALGGIEAARFGNVTTAAQAQRSKNYVTLGDYMLKWLETIKKPNVKPQTYSEYLRLFHTDIAPKFGARILKSITQFDVQAFLNEYKEQEKHRTAQKLYQLLTPLFNAAIIDEIITRSPMQGVSLTPYEQERGVPLSREEERQLVEELRNTGNVYVQAFVFLVYTGLRRSELSSVSVTDGWITVKTGKRRMGYKDKMRSIPISPILQDMLPLIDVASIVQINVPLLTKHFKKFFPNHHLHETRHTFITRAQECGIPRELVSFWVGHQPDTSMTSTVYTHFEKSRSFQKDEMQKFRYDV